MKSLIIISACCLCLASCFTGIESTPRITDKEVRKNVPAAGLTSVIADSLNAPGVAQWQPGRRFLATDAKLSMLFEKEPVIAPGDLLIFEGLNPEISITGDTITALSFRNAGDIGQATNRETLASQGATDDSASPRRKIRAKLLKYKINMAPSLMSESFTLPMSVDLDMVQEAGKLLAGRKFYIVSSLRVDSTLTPTAAGRRYVPVTISGVLPGNADYPLLVSIVDDTGSQSYVSMTVGTARSATRNFDKIFETADPRMSHPAITDAVWNNIINSRVAAGMTLEECRMALGSPRDIRKWHNGGTFFEGWTYDNGRYLIFDDGLLSEIH